jgi:hypothetical protein
MVLSFKIIFFRSHQVVIEMNLHTMIFCMVIFSLHQHHENKSLEVSYSPFNEFEMSGENP